MKFGVFDHLDASGAPLEEFYRDRLRLIEAYDRAGLYGYHTAEHHATPLGMSPSPSVLHAAIATRTTQLRFGPLVYTLPLYHPLRLAEEICMLDQLSGGRLLLGIGRGISPIELKYYGIDPKQAQAMYVEAFQVVQAALSADVLDFAGKHYRFEGVPIMMRPVQRPMPPLWYGIGNVEAVPWCAQHRVNIVSNADVTRVRAITDAYRTQWTQEGHTGEMPLMGTSRHLFIADTDAQALTIARRAYRRWIESFLFLWKRHNLDPIYAQYPDELDGLIEQDRAYVGAPDTVRRLIARQIESAGINYVLMRFAYGDMTLAESMRSLELFSRDVMPAFA